MTASRETKLTPRRGLGGVLGGLLLLSSVLTAPAPTPWFAGVLYFQFEGTWDSNQRNKVYSAMDVWSESAADVVFLPRNGADVPYFKITMDLNNANSYSSAGQPSSSSFPTTLNFNSRGMNNNWFRLHELGHALGFYHEMARPDRNTYIRLNTSNIDAADIGQYDISNNHLYNTSTYGWCFESIMMYAQCNNTGNACPNCPNDNSCTDGGRNMTVLSPNESWQNQLGTDGWNSSTSTLPDCDIDRAVSVYGSGSVRYVDKDGPGADSLGTLRDPYKTFGEARDGAPAGSRVYLDGDTYASPPTTLNRPMTYRAYPNTTATFR